MKVDLLHTAYTVAMILLAFVAALVITKTLGKYFSKDDNEQEF